MVGYDKAVQCPKCLKWKTMEVPLSWITYQPEDDNDRITLGHPLYQVGYKGEPGYISPRCSECIDKAQEASK